MKRVLLVLVAGGAALLLAGFAWGAAPAGLGLALLLVGILRLDSGILGRARTTVPRGLALTYDDGPDPDVTPALLDLLRDRGAKATFFVVGERVRAHPQIVRRARDEGHTVANHSFGHRWHTNFHFGGWMRRELEACQEAIRQATGAAARHYRPPFGLLNPYVEPAARSLGLELVGWSIRSLDSVRAGAAERVARRLAPGAIVLLHDGGPGADRVVATTRAILDAAAARDLEAVAL